VQTIYKFVCLFVCVQYTSKRFNRLDPNQAREGLWMGKNKKNAYKKLNFFNSLSPHLLIILISNSIYFKFKGTVSIHAKIEMADL